MVRRSDDRPPEDTLPDGRPSRSAQKRASDELQELGRQLMDLHDAAFDSLPITPRLRDAILEARRLRAREALRRQLQFIGKLMRQQDEATITAVRRALDARHRQSLAATRALHEAENWRERLIAADEAVEDWLARFPDTDVQQLRALIRQVRKELKPDVPEGAVRQGRAFRNLFRFVRERLERPAD